MSKNIEAVEAEIITGTADEGKATLIVLGSDGETYTVNVNHYKWDEDLRELVPDEETANTVKELVGKDIFDWIVKKGCDIDGVAKLPPIKVYPRDVDGTASIYEIANYTRARKLEPSDKRYLVQKGPWRVMGIEDFFGARRLQVFIDVDGQPVRLSMLADDVNDEFTLKYTNRTIARLEETLDALPEAQRGKVADHIRAKLEAARAARAAEMEEMTGLPFVDIIENGVEYEFIRNEDDEPETENAIESFAEVVKVKEFSGHMYCVGRIVEVKKH